jgi:hypothetical protein
MTWLWKWWRKRSGGTEARAAVDQAQAQQKQADYLRERIDQAARKVEVARVRTDLLAREVTRALGAR